MAASTISRIENGFFTPTLLTAVRLADVLALDLSNVPGLGPAAVPTDAPDPATPSDAASDIALTESSRLTLDQATSPVSVRRQILPPGIRKDLRRIACAKHYRFLTVLDGEVQIRGLDGSRVSLRPGVRLDCDLLRKDTFFAESAKSVELLWIG